jgi:sulfatase modifying factor 1
VKLRLDRSIVVLALAALGAGACGERHPDEEPSAAPSSTIPPPAETVAETPSVCESAPPAPPGPPKLGCPPDMVRVEPHPKTGSGKTAQIYCVDRYEDSVVDKPTSKPATPYYPPDATRCSLFEKIWKKNQGGGTPIEQAMPLPPLPEWEKGKAFVPMAVSIAGAVPQAYASEVDGDHACKNAGKRLCTMDEWRTACRGEEDRDFPYGEKYEAGKCNIVGPAHPGVILWKDASINHTDPRFNLVKYKGELMLRRTGATKTCVSRWGDDGIYDMNGNVDEWVDDAKGMFLGGFYARGKKDGCQSRVTAHPPLYSDYSTGIRCCSDARPETPTPVP